MKGDNVQVRVTKGEKLAILKVCELQDRSVSNFVRVACRGEILNVLGGKEFKRICNSVKGDVQSFDARDDLSLCEVQIRNKKKLRELKHPL